MKDKLPTELFELLKQYESTAETPEGQQYFTKSYELVLNCLQTKNNEYLENALQASEENEDDYLYNAVSSIMLTAIHRHSYKEDEKTYCSVLFIAPYFTITEDENVSDIHYPPVNQIEDIFKKHFLLHGLINDTAQLHIPAIKINDSVAYGMQFSDWYELHQESLKKIANPSEDEYYNQDISLPISKEGDLNFFPIIITYEDSELVEAPAICDIEDEDLPFESALASIEKDVSTLSGTGIWAIGVPSHCENALDFGLEIQQDFTLDLFFKKFMQKQDIELAIFPLETADLCILAWNKDNLDIEWALELNTYSANPQEFVDYLLEKINFYEINRTYVFENGIGYSDIEELVTFNLEAIAEDNEVIVIENVERKNRFLH